MCEKKSARYEESGKFSRKESGRETITNWEIYDEMGFKNG